MEGKGSSFFLASTNFLFFGHLAPPQKKLRTGQLSLVVLFSEMGGRPNNVAAVSFWFIVVLASGADGRGGRKGTAEAKEKKKEKKITAALCCMATSSFLSDSFRQKKICSLNLNNPNFDQEDRDLIYRLNAAILPKSLYMQFRLT